VTAVQALARFQAATFAPRVAELLKDPHSSVRSVSAWALGELKAKEFGDALIPLLDDPSYFVCGWAVVALAEFGRGDVVPRERYWHAGKLWRCGGRNPSPRVRAALVTLGYTEEQIAQLRDFEQD